MRSRAARVVLPILTAALALMSSGCPGSFSGPGFLPPAFDFITVELINDTPFEVDPFIVFDQDDGFLGSLFPGEVLATGLLLPGEIIAFDFDCDELGVIRSEEPEQYVGEFIYTAFSTRTLVQGEDFFCGDLLQFQYVGEADTFGVIVAVNGVVVD